MPDMGYQTDKELVRSEHPDASVRVMTDAALGYLASDDAPYTFHAFSADSIGIDGHLNVEAMAQAMLAALKEAGL